MLMVGLLLQGPVGAFDALYQYTRSLLQALLGGEDLFMEVVCQTAPLTLAVAVIAFAYRSRWLTFRSAGSWLLCSFVVLSATWLGGQLRSIAASPPAAQPSVQASPMTLSVEQALQQLLDFRAVATETNRHDWGETVPRVALLPEPNTLIGVGAKGINQLLGYLAVYRPRLFCAAVLLGIYLGWSWQPHFEPLLSWWERRHAKPVLRQS
jgi:hypothetical protein